MNKLTVATCLQSCCTNFKTVAQLHTMWSPSVKLKTRHACNMKTEIVNSGDSLVTTDKFYVVNLKFYNLKNKSRTILF